MSVLESLPAPSDTRTPRRDTSRDVQVAGILTDLIEQAGHYGLGWFQNNKTRKLHQLDDNTLGPHGDHDGWIALGENARALGVDPERARAFQSGLYGFDSTTTKDPASWKPYLEHDDYVSSMYYDHIPEFQRLFQDEFGYSPDDAPYLTFPELSRARWWPGRNQNRPLITFDSSSKPTAALSQLRRFLDKVEAEPGDAGEIGFSANQGDAYMTIPLEDALTSRPAELYRNRHLY